MNILSQYWDVRTPTPISTVTLPERCYTVDVAYPLMVVGTAERHIQIFNLSQPTTAFKVSPHEAVTLNFLITSHCIDDGFAIEVANEGRFMLPCRERLCRRQCRGESRYPVRGQCFFLAA